MLKILKSMSLLLCAPALLGAAVLRVPDDFSTIQGGLDAASDEDTVLVADGTYSGFKNVDLDFTGKAVVLLSENGAIATVIDCADTCRGFIFHAAEGFDTRVEGFSVRNGNASLGGAVVCLASTPTLAGCTFSGNIATGSDHGVAYGGGVYGSPLITGCTISDNLAYSAEWSQGGFGGGVYGAPAVYDSKITGNTAACTHLAGTAGGGVYCNNSSALFTSCEITGNSAVVFSAIGSASGGGISGSPTMTGCLIADNYVSSGALSGGGSGGGICGSPVLNRCIITGNTATGNSEEGDGGGLFGSPHLINCLISYNYSASSGGGIYCRGGTASLTHCTLIGNDGGLGGGGLLCWDPPNVLNCIVWDNFPGEIVGDASVSWSDVQGGYPGEGNMDANPWFLGNKDFHLSPYSPCVDAAADAGIVFDLDGDPRPLDDGYDIGVDEVLKTGAVIRLVPEDFRFLSLDSAPVPDTLLKIYSLGVLPLDYSVEACASGWLDLSGELSGSIEPGDKVKITLLIDTSGLDPGIYRDTVAVASNDPKHPVKQAPVELIVYSHGVLNVPGEFGSIQDAIDAAVDGDIVLVAAGLYDGTGNYEINFLGKRISLLSEAGPEETIIDCGKAGCGLKFTSGETQETLVDGFTISGGATNGPGGGILCMDGSPTIENCRITGCSALFSSGGGIFCGAGASPHIISCEFLENTAYIYGGGVYCSPGSGPILNTCTIQGNEGMIEGGGVACYDSSPLIQRCVIFRNVSDAGGGLSSTGVANPTIVNCTIAENFAENGCGVIINSNLMLLVHSTITSNIGTGAGGIVCENYASPDIVNCIVWRNGGPEIEGSHANVSYCDVQDGWPGTGNIDADPLFSRPGLSDYHILPASPCVDAARNTSVVSDIDGEIRPAGAAPDIGSDEVIDMSPRLRLTPDLFDIFSFDFEIPPDDTLLVRSVGGDTLHYSVVQPSVSWLVISGALAGSIPPGDTALVTLRFETGDLPVGDYADTLEITSNDPDQTVAAVPVLLEIYSSRSIHVPGDAATIQAGIDRAMDGDTVLVASGTFMGYGNTNLDFHGKSIIVASEAGPDSTMISCENINRGFIFTSGEGWSSVLEGFSILKGHSQHRGGGIKIDGGAAPVIRFCRLVRNSADEGGGGMSIVKSSPLISNCSFTDNTATDGGALFLHESTATIAGCDVRRNEALEAGGGVLADQGAPLFTNCLILNNKGRWGAGFYCVESSAVLKHVTIAGNDSTGVRCMNGSLQIIDCIIWDHSIAIDLMSGVLSVTWSDIERGWPGTGNINSDPKFKSESDFHIGRTSPCIDSGIYAEILIDIDGDPRPLGGGYDMGADEFNFTGPAIEITPGRFDPFAFDPDPVHECDTLSITNIGSGSLLYNVHQGQEGWVQASGEVQGALSQGETAVVLFHYILDGLAVGSHTDTITIGSGDPVFPLVPVPVDLEILPLTIRVPEDYAAIQNAIDAARPGQHVEVSPGVYSGIGNRDLDYSGKDVCVIGIEGPEATLLDCENLGRGAAFESGESRDARFEGFTVKNGYKQNGGAILCDASSPVVVDCFFDAGSANFGGGVACRNGAASAIDFCIFLGNGAESSGGGLFCDAASPDVTDCFFSGNYSGDEGGGVFCIDGAAPTLFGTTFYGNISVSGGGISCAGGASPHVERCLFLENDADNGGGVSCLDGCSPLISSCTFSWNRASASGGAVFSNFATLVLENSILWNDLPAEIYYLVLSPSVTWSDVEGGWEGVGNIDEDPMFKSPQAGDYTLGEGSPCIDAGNPLDDVPLGGGVNIDMGACELDQGFTLLETTSPW